VGLGEVLQQTPLYNFGKFPSELIFPPQYAENEVIDVTSVVVNTGKSPKTQRTDMPVFKLENELPNIPDSLLI